MALVVSASSVRYGVVAAAAVGLVLSGGKRVRDHDCGKEGHEEGEEAFHVDDV